MAVYTSPISGATVRRRQSKRAIEEVHDWDSESGGLVPTVTHFVGTKLRCVDTDQTSFSLLRAVLEWYQWIGSASARLHFVDHHHLFVSMHPAGCLEAGDSDYA